MALQIASGVQIVTLATTHRSSRTPYQLALAIVRIAFAIVTVGLKDSSCKKGPKSNSYAYLSLHTGDAILLVRIIGTQFGFATAVLR